nr:zinc finger, CCHC-type [Tanacetum cinerariifolium]
MEYMIKKVFGLRWNCRELKGDRKAKVFQVSNDDTVVAQRQLEDKQPEEKTNTDCLVKEQENVHHGADVGAVIMKTKVPGQEGAKGNAAKRYREDSNEAAFVVAAVEKIYAHESLTLNDTVSCEVISKWKAGLKEDSFRCICVQQRLQENQCKAEIWVTKGLLVKAKGNILGLEIIKDRSVGSQEYQVVYTRPDIASTGMDMLDGFDRGLETSVQVFVNLSYALERSITVMSRSVIRYGLMILGCKEA